MSARPPWHDGRAISADGILAGVGLVLLAAIVSMAAGSPAPLSTDWQVSDDAAVRWPPAARGIERARADALAVLFRARARGSVEDVLGACETFAAFGDREVVSGCVRIARGLPGAAGVDDRLRELEQSQTRRQP